MVGVQLDVVFWNFNVVFLVTAKTLNTFVPTMILLGKTDLMDESLIYWPHTIKSTYKIWLSIICIWDFRKEVLGWSIDIVLNNYGNCCMQLVYVENGLENKNSFRIYGGCSCWAFLAHQQTLL